MSDSLDVIKLLQITDTHLFSEEEGALLNVNTRDSFNAVVEMIQSEGVSFDAIVATGDISQDHSAASYQRFLDGITPLKKPCLWLPGNHDYQPNMGEVLPSQQVLAIEHSLLGKHWQVIVLDSQVVGKPHGRLSDQQLDLLDRKLSEHAERHTLVLLHHHPILVGSAWLDQHTLKDSEDFWTVVEKHTNVKVILCGHVHQDFDHKRGDVRVMATPSTCVQFKPRSTDFALDNQAPGWRELELHASGRLETRVRRLNSTQFMPDFASGGY
ncbi:3',5'-cyclic-AMP phosphodiesterase [Vibrio sp. FNV 38]|nr:3',5'-cyclic-AMP phosphodiesterase [Vibrio sp. FNV 38]